MTTEQQYTDTDTGLIEVLPAVLGWANPERDRESCRLYALDAGPGPRWLEPPHGRVVEQAIRERVTPYPSGLGEGDRYLIVRVGGRFVTDEAVAHVTTGIRRLLQEIPDRG